MKWFGSATRSSIAWLINEALKTSYWFYSSLGFICFLAILIYKYGRSYWYPVYLKFIGENSISDIVEQYQSTSLERIKSSFESANIVFPPKELAFLAIKEDASFKVWAKNGSAWRLVKVYSIKAASGVLGPKLREGDYQVPEGIYGIS